MLTNIIANTVIITHSTYVENWDLVISLLLNELFLTELYSINLYFRNIVNGKIIQVPKLMSAKLLTIFYPIAVYYMYQKVVALLLLYFIPNTFQPSCFSIMQH